MPIFSREALENAARQFLLCDAIDAIVPYGSGHIHDTFLVTPKQKRPRYILQRINTQVFENPVHIMENTVPVTQHLAKRTFGAIGRQTPLTFLEAANGQYLHVDADGHSWRMSLFVENTITYQLPDSPHVFYEAARAFGHFFAMLSDYPVHTLHETIPRFHDTLYRYEQLDAAILQDPLGRAKAVQQEIAFSMAHQQEAAVLNDMHLAGRLPLRVTHNDTKLNNVLLDATSGKGVCVLDLDTVMPGLSVHDYGEAIRYGANTAQEDETDLRLCSLSLSMFEAYTIGFLEEASAVLLEEEIAAFPLGAKMMALENGIRFLADYLLGDVYYKIKRPDHNLDRARTQFHLIKDMEAKWRDMAAIVSAAANSV